VDIAALPGPFMKMMFFSSMAATLSSDIYYIFGEKGAWLFGGLSALNCAVSLLSILSFISLYIYELPTHHYPFCLLQREYGFIGYPLYLSLFSATILGAGVGVLMPFMKIDSLSEAIPTIQKRIALAAAVLLSVFALIVVWKIIFSDLILGA
jgi:hypothetical protein